MTKWTRFIQESQIRGFQIRGSRLCPASQQRPLFLYVAQCGGKHRDTKVLSGFGGAGVVEIVTDHRGDTYRAVYTLRYAGAVYVLHAFQNKSKSGRATPRREIDLIKKRIREAEQLALEIKL